jgi:hypothetical protein
MLQEALRTKSFPGVPRSFQPGAALKGPDLSLKPFQRKNIFLLTMEPVNKYFFRVPAHVYFKFLVTGARLSGDALPETIGITTQRLPAQNQMEQNYVS